MVNRRRTKVLAVTVTPEEHSRIKKDAERLGYSNMAEYARRILLVEQRQAK